MKSWAGFVWGGSRWSYLAEVKLQSSDVPLRHLHLLPEGSTKSQSNLQHKRSSLEMCTILNYVNYRWTCGTVLNLHPSHSRYNIPERQNNFCILVAWAIRLWSAQIPPPQLSPVRGKLYTISRWSNLWYGAWVPWSVALLHPTYGTRLFSVLRTSI